MGPNLWELVQRISDPDKWREQKVQELRNQWGYDKTTSMQNQGDSRTLNSIYSDSLPLSFDENLRLKYPTWEANKKIMEKRQEKQDTELLHLTPEMRLRYQINEGIMGNYKDRKRLDEQML
jgi:hypothetical protein